MKIFYPTLVCFVFMTICLAYIPVQGQNTSDYQTFNFLDFDVELLTEHQVEEKNIDYLKSAIVREMESKGLKQASNPDLAINIGLVVEEEVQTRETDARDMRYMGQRNYTWEVEEVVVGVYKVGTVSIEFVDTKENKAVWEKSDANVIRKSKGVQKKIDKAVKRIFKKFDVNKLGS